MIAKTYLSPGATKALIAESERRVAERKARRAADAAFRAAFTADAVAYSARRAPVRHEVTMTERLEERAAAHEDRRFTGDPITVFGVPW